MGLGNRPSKWDSGTGLLTYLRSEQWDIGNPPQTFTGDGTGGESKAMREQRAVRQSQGQREGLERLWGQQAASDGL